MITRTFADGYKDDFFGGDFKDDFGGDMKDGFGDGASYHGSDPGGAYVPPKDVKYFPAMIVGYLQAQKYQRLLPEYLYDELYPQRRAAALCLPDWIAPQR